MFKYLVKTSPDVNTIPDHPLKKQVVSCTFGDVSENHYGMEQLGDISPENGGFNTDDLTKAQKIFEENEYTCELFDLGDLCDNISELPESHILVIHNGANFFLEKQGKTTLDTATEFTKFEWDTKYWDTRHSKVLNKHARSNVCFGDESQEPYYENGKGRVVSYSDVKCLKSIRDNLHIVLGEKGRDLKCEGNRYFDLGKCGIGWHGDAERRKVVAFRFGEQMSMNFNWFHRHKPIGIPLQLDLDDGDMYIMSEYAVGTNWRQSSKYTIRHSAGSDKYTNLDRFKTSSN
jgi:hypothetical protein